MNEAIVDMRRWPNCVVHYRWCTDDIRAITMPEGYRIAFRLAHGIGGLRDFDTVMLG